MNTEENAIPTIETQSTHEQNASSALTACRPVTATQSADPNASSGKIRRPRRDEPFTTVGQPMIIACIVDRKRDSWGNPGSEDYHPVVGTLQPQAGSDLRSIAFHPCATASGETFIYPQKLDPPNTWANSWNASLAQALAHPAGQWRTVWSDKTAECYKHELVEPPMEGIPEYPNFREDLEQALTPNIITSLDHPVFQQLIGQQEGHIHDEEIY